LKEEATKKIESALFDIQNAQKIVTNKIAQSHNSISEITNQGQALRSEVDKIQKGYGEVSRKCQILRNDISQLESIALVSTETNERIKELQLKRNLILDKLEETRSKRSMKRSLICQALSTALSPK
ncbi:MAG TPA: hypothetical protein DDW91_15970, partial [Shewanella frigidimarina]|nr:hypothetical protein [Shewanella frigidimarina]